MDETLREQIALFRYGVVNELVSRPLASGEKQRLLEAIAEKEWDIPGSRRRQIGQSTAATWVKLYEAMGFDGLKPRPRSDKGASRAVPEPVQELFLQLRRERPKAAVTSLIRAARLSGRVDADVSLAPSTLYRLFSAHGLETKPTATTPDAKAWATSFTGPIALVWRMRDPILGRLLPRHERAFPSATVRRTEAGHFLQEEVPDLLAAAIREVAQRAGRWEGELTARHRFR